MAYDFTVTGPVRRHEDGKDHLTWTIVETDVQIASEWSIPDFPTPCTFTVYTVHLHTPGAASGVKPKFGMATNPSVGIDFINEFLTETTFDRSEVDTRVHGIAGTTLYGRSMPNADGAGRVETRITVVRGHL